MIVVGKYVLYQVGQRWLVCLAQKQDYCISDHPTLTDANAAAARYTKADKRRARNA